MGHLWVGDAGETILLSERVSIVLQICLNMMSLHVQLEELLCLENLVANRTGNFAACTCFGLTPATQLFTITQVGEIIRVKGTSVRVNWHVIPSENFVKIVCGVFIHLQGVACRTVIVGEIFPIRTTSS